MPRVLHISIARYAQELPQPGTPLDFLVSLHEEGTGITWQQNVTVPVDAEKYFLDTVQELFWWSQKLALSSKSALKRVQALGARLYEQFLGAEGQKFLDRIVPTAVLLDVDETILNLPWELMAGPGGPIARQAPFGRLVTTRVLPRPGRDPIQEDQAVRILVVANPTGDLPSAEEEASTLTGLQGQHGPFGVEVTTLVRGEATLARFRELLSSTDFDMLHFAGHSALDPSKPETSSLRFADSALSADEILSLPWKAPPYLVFNSSCESGRAVGGLRLVDAANHHNGLAAAFLAAGVYGYAGYFWPVTDGGAQLFAMTFYQTLFLRENVGLAFLEARREAISQLGDQGDLTGYSAVLFGDAASAHRRDLAMAV